MSHRLWVYYILYIYQWKKVLFDYFISGYCDVHPMYFPYDSHLCFVSFINGNPLHEQEIFRLNYTMTRGVHLGIPNTRNGLLIFWFDRGNRGNLWPWKQISILFFEILIFYRIFTCSQTLSSILKGATVCHTWDFLICYAKFNSKSDSERKTRCAMGSRGC